MIDMIEEIEIDIVEKDQGHLQIIIEDIEVEVIQVQDIKVVDHPRDVLSVVKQDIILKSVGIFRNI